MFEQKFAFSLVVFCVHMRQFHFDFYRFFSIFGLDFFLNGFPSPFIGSRSNFLFSQ